MKWKLNKKVLIGSIALIGALSITALLVTSCSSTPSPTFAISVNVGGSNFNIQNGRVTSDAITIDGVSYTSPPNFDKTKPETQKARAVYDLIANFGVWLYGSSNSLSTFISRMPTAKNFTNPVLTKTSVIESGLDFAISSFLGLGASTYQLGIRNIIVDDIITEITNNVIPYDDKSLSVDEPPDNKVEIIIPNIIIKYGWWRSEGGSKISWIDTNQFSSISKSSFVNSKVDAKEEYELKLQDISFEASRYAKNAEGKWFPNGVLTIEQGALATELPFYFGSKTTTILNRVETKNIFDQINDANKAASGDYSDKSFNQVLKQFPNLITNFNKILK